MSEPRQVTVRDYVRMLRASGVAVYAMTILCAAAAFGFSSAQKPIYLAAAQLSFQGDSQSNAEAGVVAPETQTPAALAARGVTSVLSPTTLQRARAQLGATRSISDLQKLVSTQIDPSSNLVTVEIRSSDKQFAAALANALAQATVDLQTQSARAGFASAANRVQAELTRLRHTQQGNDQALALSFFARIASLRTLSVNATPVSLVQPASVPGSPDSPRTSRNTLFGAIIGLLLGVIFAFVRSSVDRRLRFTEQIQEELDLAIVGSIREDALGQAAYIENSLGSMSDQDLESFRILRTNLVFLDIERPLKSIVVTSPLPQEGKSTVAASLALALTAAGTSTLLVECDLRRPCLAGRLSINAGPGLSDLLAGKATLAEVVQLVELSAGDAAAANGDAKGAAAARRLAEKLAVVTAGSPSIRPAELLCSQPFRTFIDDAVRAYDVVIVDTPPLLSVADTLEIIPLVEGLLLCIRADQTTRDQARALSRALARLPERPTGVVVTGVKVGREADYGYYSYAEADAH
ncbi:MAG: tyrosine-protein kinase [Solirubrobacteraceae bacterium]|jgi:capsular exopolysaccharide synthesis family protein|nr:tyrosine-protein kinase [Solirubrobacteraceae bacterium]